MQRLERGLVSACDALACGVLALMAVIVFFEVVSRSVFGFSTGVAEELASISLIVVLFLGLPGSFSQNAMIRVDVLYQTFGQGLKRVLDKVFALVALVVSAVYAHYLFDLTRRSFLLDFRSDTMLAVPAWIPQTTMVAGVVALAVAALASLLSRRSAVQGETHPGERIRHDA